MDFACPVCGSPQVDRRHLANHVAFTALLRGGDHEAWLDERVPGWSELDEDGLADRLAALPDEDLTGAGEPAPTAPEADADHAHAGSGSGPSGIENAGGPGAGRGAGDDRDRHEGRNASDGSMPAAERLPDDAVLDDEAREVLEEAAELTRRRRENADGPADDADEA